MKKQGLLLGVCLLLDIALGVQSQQALAEGRIMKAIEIARACAVDVRRLCQAVRPGRGRIKACIKEKLDQASPACREALLGTSIEPADEHFDQAVKESAQGGVAVKEGAAV